MMSTIVEVEQHLRLVTGLAEDKVRHSGSGSGWEMTTNALRSTFDDRIQSEIHSRGWYRSGRNVEEATFNKGARVGMQQIVDEYAKKCFNDSAAADVCNDLGDLSAFDLALRHCGSTRTSSRGAFHSVCRDIGISQCQGSVFSRVADLCGPPSTSELLSLQNECESAVMRRS